MELLEDILGGEQSHTISRNLSDEEIKHIEAMITCEKGGQPAPSGKKWLYEVRPLTTSRVLGTPPILAKGGPAPLPSIQAILGSPPRPAEGGFKRYGRFHNQFHNHVPAQQGSLCSYLMTGMGHERIYGYHRVLEM